MIPAIIYIACIFALALIAGGLGVALGFSLAHHAHKETIDLLEEENDRLNMNLDDAIAESVSYANMVQFLERGGQAISVHRVQ